MSVWRNWNRHALLVPVPWRTAPRSLKWVNTEFLCDPAIPLPGLHPRELTTCPHKILHKNAHSIVIIIIIIAPKCKPRYPSTDEWINKMWYSHTVEYYSAVKKTMKYGYLLQYEWALKTLHQNVKEASHKTPHTIPGTGNTQDWQMHRDKK